MQLTNDHILLAQNANTNMTKQKKFMQTKSLNSGIKIFTFQIVCIFSLTLKQLILSLKRPWVGDKHFITYN